jgi:hypothetical protein
MFTTVLYLNNRLLIDHYSPLWSLASNTNFSCIVFSTNLFLRDYDVNPMPNPQPGAPGCLLVWNLTLDLSGLGDPASSYATVGIALEIIGARKPHRHDKADTPQLSNSENDNH